MGRISVLPVLARAFSGLCSSPNLEPCVSHQRKMKTEYLTSFQEAL